MNRFTATLLTTLALAACAPRGTSAQALKGKLDVTFRNHFLRDALVPDGRFSRAQSVPGVDQDVLRDYFHHGATGGYLSAAPERLYGIEQYEVSRLAVTLEGAERLASTALFVSALGTTFAGWDEKSAMTFVGAAAAAGALWGGVAHGDDPGWRIRYRWEPDEWPHDSTTTP
jgi:hypothetical protein